MGESEELSLEQQQVNILSLRLSDFIRELNVTLKLLHDQREALNQKLKEFEKKKEGGE